MIEELYKIYLSSTGVSTDTRKIQAGNIFFALKGPNFNANELAGEAIRKGALLAVIDEADHADPGKTFLVPDVLNTLQQLAVHHRKQLMIPIIGITGSNGKTTTKELIRKVLEVKYRCFATEGNLNNHIGVPLTLLSMSQDLEIGIVEMGANKIGDIRQLCEIASPTHGVITNIGKAHTEGFGGLEGVLKGKTELYDWLLKHDGKVFINAMDTMLWNMSERFTDPVSYPRPGDYYHCELINHNPTLTIRTERGKMVPTRLLGAYNFPNVATALCIGKYFNVDPDLADLAVSAYEPSNNRSQVLMSGTNMIILDAYNANPDSMKAALSNLSDMEGAKKVVILGDMFELGDLTEEEHRGIGVVTRNAGFEEVIFCGERMKYAAKENTSARYFPTRQELENYIEKHSFEHCQILIKGSRAMALEHIVEKINEK